MYIGSYYLDVPSHFNLLEKSSPSNLKLNETAIFCKKGATKIVLVSAGEMSTMCGRGNY